MDKIKINKDNNIFVNLKDINEIRRKLVDLLINIRSNPKKEIIINNDKIINDYIKSNNKNYLNVLVRNEEQLKCCIDNGVDNIYVTDYDLYIKYRDLDNIYYRCCRVNSKYREISKLLDIPLSVVDNYIHICKEKLRIYLSL